MRNDDTINELSERWINAKADEASAIARRRALEDLLVAELAVDENVEGTINAKAGIHAIKITTRLTRKVDGEKLQLLALENGISHDVLQQLFRWKPELALREWKAAENEVRAALAGAITTSAGRPSVSIETTETKE